MYITPLPDHEYIIFIYIYTSCILFILYIYILLELYYVLVHILMCLTFTNVVQAYITEKQSLKPTDKIILSTPSPRTKWKTN